MIYFPLFFPKNKDKKKKKKSKKDKAEKVEEAPPPEPEPAPAPAAPAGGDDGGFDWLSDATAEGPISLLFQSQLLLPVFLVRFIQWVYFYHFFLIGFFKRVFL